MALARDLMKMAFARKRRSADRPAARWLGLDRRRALIACLCLGSLFALGSRFDGSSPATVHPGGSAQRTAGDDDLTTGSILFVPRFGDECRLRLIDNATWRISDQGVVDCQTALAQSKSRPHSWSAARVDVIRDGFRKR